MTSSHSLPRRALLAASGVAVAMPAAAQAPAAHAPMAKPDTTLWRGEYTATKPGPDGQPVKLMLYRKRLGAPRAGERARPVLFLVHGSSASALPSFDLIVPGRLDYSLMDQGIAWGFDVWTMDHEGYGRSGRTTGNSNIASGVEDLKAAAEIIRRETGQTRMHMIGESSGALRVAAYAAAQPDRAGRLVLSAYTYTGQGSETLGKRAEQVEYYRTHNRRPRDKAMLMSIFTRDRPGTTDPAVAEAFASAEIPYGDSVPAGTYLDMTAHLPVVQPDKVLAPVLLIRGEFDGIATLEDIMAFYSKLPNGDRQLVIVPGAAHSLGTCLHRNAFFHASRAFLTQPTMAS